jgi:predicted phage-related endonuclease
MIIRDRRVGIGASEVPVIAGISPYASPVELWLKKTGGPETPDSGPMAIGRALEVPLLRELAYRDTLLLRHNTQRRAHPDWPRVPLYATPDAVGPKGAFLGEIKVVGVWNSSEWAAGVPAHVRLQVQAQMAVFPKAAFCAVGALVNGTDLRIERVQREPETIAEIERRVADWWRTFVVSGTPPPPASEDDEWALLRRFVTIAGRPQRIAYADENATAQAYANQDRLAKQHRGNADVLRRLLAEAAKEVDLMGAGWSGKWHDRQGTPVFTLRIQDEKEQLA